MDGFVGSLTGLVAVLAIFGVPGVWLLGKSDIGKAIVERIRHGTHGLPDPQLLAELDEMKDQLAEVQDRLEFAERTMAALKPGAARASST
ncbi:MAG TPA: hypothetical protein VGR60_01150 [Gemmatimonadales bacterium]|nr:hypothetical protein [Gemmatimonadales bacterium]